MTQERTHCRICDGKLETVLDMGTIYQSNFLTDASRAILAPLNLARCIKCNLVQLKHDGNLDSMYRQYWYKSSLNQSMVEALRSVVDSICFADCPHREQFNAGQGNFIVKRDRKLFY